MFIIVSAVIPEMYKFCHLAYNEHSILQFREFCLTSQEDSLHGNPLGGLMSGNPSSHPLDHLRSHHWSYGRHTLGGTRKEVSEDVQLFIEKGITIGLRFDQTTCDAGTFRLLGFSSEHAKSSGPYGRRLQRRSGHLVAGNAGVDTWITSAQDTWSLFNTFCVAEYS